MESYKLSNDELQVSLGSECVGLETSTVGKEIDKEVMEVIGKREQAGRENKSRGEKDNGFSLLRTFLALPPRWPVPEIIVTVVECS